MKLSFKKPRSNIYKLMRRLGYHFQRKKNQKLVFSRSLSGSSFPRFHIYLKVGEDNLIFNLHLDQKPPTYKGVSAHSGEYSGPPVEKEAKRIKQILQHETRSRNTSDN